MNKLYEAFHDNTLAQDHFIKQNNFTYRIILKVLNKYIKKNQNILDIGCGAGTISFYVNSLKNKVLGVDISERAINKCKNSAKKLNLKNIEFKVNNFPNEKLSGKYDVILLLEVIEHIEKDKEAINSLYNMLNKNGLIILSTPSVNAPVYKLGLADKFDKRVGHVRRYSGDTLKELFDKDKYKILEVYKNEGLLRNFLFINPVAGKFIRFIKFGISDAVTFIDNILLKLFGESDYFIIVQKR